MKNQEGLTPLDLASVSLHTIAIHIQYIYRGTMSRTSCMLYREMT